MHVQAPAPTHGARPRSFAGRISHSAANTSTIRTTPIAQQSGTGLWRERAIAAYQQSLPDAESMLRAELASRIIALTAQDIDAAAIYANAATQLAVANVDGIVFRLQQHELKIVRPCTACGVGQFESRIIMTLQDVGHALTAWEPRCIHCTESDPINWLDLEG